MSDKVTLELDSNESKVVTEAINVLVKTQGIHIDPNVFMVGRTFLERLSNAWNEVQKQEVFECEGSDECGSGDKQEPSS